MVGTILEDATPLRMEDQISSFSVALVWVAVPDGMEVVDWLWVGILDGNKPVLSLSATVIVDNSKKVGKRNETFLDSTQKKLATRRSISKRIMST